MLNFDGITVRLGGRTIIDRATAALPSNSRIGLIGRNGAGKSTLMKVLIGSFDPDEGRLDMPRSTRIGYIAQEAPSGTSTPIETVLAADTERAALMIEVENCEDPNRLGEVHERLLAIDAYAAPARAARILVGLGFDEEMQNLPLDSYSGGWKMRVALAALLFSQPDLLLLDEPSNHLDLEATLWLESFLKSYPGMMVVISHERDLLNNVVDHILHLENGKTTLYPGGYDAFERQRAERAAQLAAAKASQDAQRAKLQDYIARNSARASTAKQAQSRAKALAKMQPIAAMAEDPTLSFDFPNPDALRPPLVTLDMASVGYTEKAAKEAGFEVKVGKFPFSASGKASAAGAKDGFVKVIYDAKYGELLGAHMIGANVTEMIAEIVAARKLETTGMELLKAVHPHPTMSEAVMEATAAAYGEVIHL